MRVKKCKKCGQDNYLDMKFCTACGNKFEDDDVDVKSDSNTNIVYCQNCGSKNSTDNKFCESCGAPLDEEIEDTTEEELVQEDIETEESEVTKEDKDQEEILDNKSLIQENVRKDVKDKASLVKEQKRDKKQKNSKKIKISKKQMKIILLIIVILVFSTFTICFTIYQSKHSWSKWVSKLPTDVTDSKYVIEKKKQYSIKTKKTTTSSKETLKGWTLDKSNLPNAEELEKEISTIEEIKKFESNKDVTINNKEVIEEQYEAVLCGYYNPNETSNRFYTPNDSKPYCNKDDSYTLTENIANQPKDTYKIGDDYKDKYYTNTDGNKIYYKIVSSTPVKVKYKYSNKTTDSLYHFYKWTAWSEYSDKEQKDSSTVKVRERIVYRYKVR